MGRKPLRKLPGSSGRTWRPTAGYASGPTWGDLTDEERCQLNRAVADVGGDGAWRLFQVWALSSIKPDPPDASLIEAVEDIEQAQSFSWFVAERGYTY
jgi:hypothetical protein